MSLDAAGRKLYWAESDWDVETETYTGRIQRSNLDGSDVELLAAVLDVWGLEVTGSKLYWTEWDTETGTSKIRRANLDGSDVELLFTDWDLQIQALAVDLGGS